MGQKAHPDYLRVLVQARADGVATPSYRQIIKHNCMVRRMDTYAGAWDHWDCVYLFQQNASEAFGYYNWKDPSTYKITKSGTVTWTSDVGSAGNASSGVYATGYVGGGSTKFQQNNCSITASISGATVGSQIYLGKGTSTTSLTRVNGSRGCRLNCNSSATVVSSTGSFASFQRNNSSTVDSYANGVLEGSGVSQTSSAISAFPFSIFAYNGDGTNQFFTNGTIKFVAFGEYFASDHLALVNAFADYSNAP